MTAARTVPVFGFYLALVGLDPPPAPPVTEKALGFHTALRRPKP